MNRIILLLLLCSFLSLQAVEWNNWEEGLAKAKQTRKLIMLDVIRDNCRFCTDMDKKVFDDEKMAKWVEACFVPVKLNLSHDTLPMGIQVRVTPTFIFLTPEKDVVKTIQGSWDIKDFKELSQNLCKEY